MWSEAGPATAKGEAHPHSPVTGVPVRLPKETVQRLSHLQPARALAAVGTEWAGIAAAIAACILWPNVFVYIGAIVFIGARQHALAIIAHDASHFRFLPNRRLNDGLADLLLSWPLLMSVQGYRAFHGPHHRFLDDERDGNRVLYQTHTAGGELAPDWIYPKTRWELVLALLRYTFSPAGLWSGLVTVILMFRAGSWRARLGQVSFHAVVATLLTLAGWWPEYLLLWLVPMRVWFVPIQHARLIAEHSAVHSDDPAFADTRTVVPRWWEALFILPRNIGYHIEHHWYPSVPFYNLPALHRALMAEPRYRERANICRSVLSSLGEVTAPAN